MRLLRSLRRLRQGTGGRLLEVGSAHGWFLEAARQDFDEAVGVEPDGDVRSEPESCQVRAGFFPAAVAPGERFDVIAFNDVFEHIRPTADVAEAVANALSPGGIAMINLPMASGGIYRLTALLHRCGLRSPFERMWQIEFPSPHLYYFSARGLRQLFASRGLELVSEIDMPTLRAKGLWQRIRHAEPNLPVAIASYVGSLAALPVQQLLPADVKCLFFRAPER